MDEVDRLLLDRIQRSFPLGPEPYRELGEALGVSAEEVLERLSRLQAEGMLRQISAIFNTGELGYRSSLVSMAVPEAELDRAAQVVNGYPGVSHNYLRPDFSFNLWYTVAVPPGDTVEAVVGDLAAEAGGWPVLILPALRKYKLAVVLDILEDGDGDGEQGAMTEPQLQAVADPFDPSPENVRIVRCIQEDLPRVLRPFAVWARSLDMTEDELLQRIGDWLQRGYIRRFAAVLDHRQVGFGANGIIVWNCPEKRLDEVGGRLAASAEVTHCYHRPSAPQWPYNLYAMVHGRSRQDCRDTAAELAAAVDLPDYRILFSTREYKKIRLKLFWDHNRD